MTPVAVKLFVFPAAFGPAIGDQLGDEVAVAGRLTEVFPQSFENRQWALENQSAALDAGTETVSLLKAKLCSQCGWNHDATLSTNFDLCHQELSVPDM